ncbi:MAG: helix-turn-helix domain-containing protein [Leifsonia sp.]
MASEGSLPEAQLLYRSRPTNTVDATADFLCVDRKTVYAAIRDGTIPALKLGRRLLIPTEKLLALIQ